jgi:hypothetical protein
LQPLVDNFELVAVGAVADPNALELKQPLLCGYGEGGAVAKRVRRDFLWIAKFSSPKKKKRSYISVA